MAVTIMLRYYVINISLVIEKKAEAKTLKKKSRRIEEKKLVKKNLHERDIKQNTEALIRYLGLNEATPNTGTKNKRDLMVRALTLLKDWELGSVEEWSNRLSLRLNISAKTAKENYIRG